MSAAQMEHMNSLLDAEMVYEPDELLRACRFFLYDQIKVLESAVEIVDGPYVSERNVSKIRCIRSRSSSRSFWIVPGSRGAEYTCTSCGCTCQNFLELSKSAGVNVEVMCKHLIAIRLATALDGVINETLKDEDWVNELSSRILPSFQGMENKPCSFPSDRAPHFQPY